MPRYRDDLPQLRGGQVMLTDGGLETDLIFHHGVDLPSFAACELLRSQGGTLLLRDYYDENARIATDAGIGFSIDTPTWRANPDWTAQLGYDDAEFEMVNRAGVQLAEQIRERHETPDSPMPIAGVVGPRGDGYRPGELQSAEEATEYHARQIALFADSAVDYVVALTLNYPDEGVGVALAAREESMPVVVSFTVETDGCLASGDTLGAAISAVDAASEGFPAYFMVNCAHPSHLPAELLSGEAWTRRVRGIRSNASRHSHAELDEAEQLDDGDPIEFGRDIRNLIDRMPQLAIVGGCCGSDRRHIRGRRRDAVSHAPVGSSAARQLDGSTGRQLGSSVAHFS